MSNGWKCSQCTYYHHAPAERCAMCLEPRVSKQAMCDFIQGKPIPDDSAASPSRKKDPRALKQAILSTSETAHSVKQNQSADKPPAPKRPLHNPYLKKTAPAPVAHSSEPCPPPASNQTHMANQSTMTSKLQAPSAKVSNKSSGTQRTLQGLPVASTTAIRAKPKSTTAKAHAPLRSLPFQPGPVPVCPETTNEWIYPNDPNFPKRNYQFSMTQTALFHNTLVSLPTGLGKTLIAAVVMYNYYRWFPTGKVIFMAPTLPLVTQQVKACYDIMGIPEGDTAVLTGKTSPERRLLVWQSQRVFFCTPQTVQRDLESERVDATKIVCVVLDEAHKATGDYAYCKVVQALEERGARFRVLGLSATPGSTIKAIQAVVDALRINKVEARRDNDADVKQYIHDRQTEIVIVKRASASKEVERKLTDLIAPLLERLRSRNAMNRCGNSTLTQFQLVQARTLYQERTKDFSLTHVFTAAIKLVKMRDDLHRQGIGVVRIALTRMLKEKQKGTMASVVASQPFRDLWELVSQSSYDPQSGDTNIENRVMNNPKLSKLRDILVEHFDRSRAVGNSSRAIVFSQFRDSVSIIVDMLRTLRPVILPRYFVGQAKGTQSDTGSMIKGMSQAEQQQVIKQFRDGVHNVLVCTCIGEEGLDIGEVDLIVNFDTLKSPIRMIQRVGRTGRKRSGRVVCLVAEGPEHNTLNQSRQSERNLAHALKRPESFKVSPTLPLLPVAPVLKEQNMQIFKTFRMSQVEGHSKSGTSACTKSSDFQNGKAWKLSDDAETRRAAVMGSSNELAPSFSKNLSLALKKQLLQGRLLQSRGVDERLSSRLGRVSRAVKMIESQSLATTTVRAGRKRRRNPNEMEHYLDICFPLTSNEDGFETVAWGKFTENQKPSHGSKGLRQSDETNGTVGKVFHATAVESSYENLDRQNASPSQKQDESLPYTNLPRHPEVPKAFEVRHVEEKQPVAQEKPLSENFRSCGPWLPDEQPMEDDWRLPTPTSSSDEESDDEQESEQPQQEQFNNVATNRPMGRLETIPEDTLVLPSQRSSSEESESEETETRKVRQNSSDKGAELRMETTLKSPSVKRHGKIGAERRGTVHKSSPKRRLPEIAGERAESPLNQSGSNPSVFGGRRKECHDGGATDRARKARRIFDESSPVDSDRKRFSTGNMSANNADPLLDTQISPDRTEDQEIDIVCAICSSGESPDEDPIVLCDGPGGGSLCNVAVHTSCYCISVDVVKAEEWRCEVCQYKFDGGRIRPKCFICNESSVPLSRFLGNEWVHTTCKQFAEDAQRNSENRAMGTHRNEGISDPVERKRRRHAVRAIKKRQYGNFFDEEADIDDDEECDEDEEVVAQQIEDDEEFYKDFINDSSQLGYTQDELDRADPDDDHEHRALDTERALQAAFATPILNRQMQNTPRSDNSSVPASVRGLGQMHFIRSVIEHHRQGGSADQIEKAYEELEAQATPATTDGDQASHSGQKRRSYHFDDSDSD